jgi:flotillin
MVLDALPKVAQPYADALGTIDDITIIDKDGASRLPGQVSTGVQELATMLKAQTGIDLLDLLRGLGGNTPAPTGRHDAPTPSHAPAGLEVTDGITS